MNKLKRQDLGKWIIDLTSSLGWPDHWVQDILLLILYQTFKPTYDEVWIWIPLFVQVLMRILQRHCRPVITHLTAAALLFIFFIFVWINIVLQIFSLSIHHIPDHPAPTFIKCYNQSSSPPGMKSTNVTILYKSFPIHPPLFADEFDQYIFQQTELYPPGPVPQEKLTGQISTILNGIIHDGIHTCGWSMNLREFQEPLPPCRTPRQSFNLLIPLLVPNSNSFQHFVDGVLPKIAQIHPFIQQHRINASFMFYRPWDKIIEEMIHEMRISNVVFHDGGFIHAHILIDSCIAPPIHPQLWTKVRSLLHVQDIPKDPPKQVVLLLRHRTRNPGRKIINIHVVIQYLQKTYSTRLHIFKQHNTLAETKQIFQDAEVVIGVHGGAFYNALFCPVATKFIEIVPVGPDGQSQPGHSGRNIMWHLTQMANQTYVRLYQEAINKRSDVYLPLDRLCKALKKFHNYLQCSSIPSWKLYIRSKIMYMHAVNLQFLELLCVKSSWLLELLWTGPEQILAL